MDYGQIPELGGIEGTYLGDDGLLANVWGTQGLNDCPAAAGEALDAPAIQAEEMALAVLKNGPRLWLVDRTTGSGAFGEIRTAFGLADDATAVTGIVTFFLIGS